MPETSSTYQPARQWLREHSIQRLTWGDVDKFIREHNLDDDEYFEVHTIYRHHHADWKKAFVYADKIRWIAVYWVVGGSEGYYVHVETREPETQKTELVLLGKFWWLDAGNGEETGQVLFGAARNIRQLQYAFPYYPDQGFCVNLPAPDLQHPELLQVQVEQTAHQLKDLTNSCAEMLLTGDQSPSINAMVANIAATYLWHLFADPKGLTTFATYCNLTVLSMRSRYITPDNVAQVMHKPTKMFKSHKRD